jgi:protein SCO1
MICLGRWAQRAPMLLTLSILAFAQQPPSARGYFTDTVLLDQNGESKRFYSDLLQGKVVIINAFFSSCKDSCPLMSEKLAKLQTALLDRGEDVRILSFSVDPETDTPPRLKAYAERWHAKPGWFFLTGSIQNLNIVLRKLGLQTADKTNHLTTFYIGNEATGLWKKALSSASTDQLLPIVESVLKDRS